MIIIDGDQVPKYLDPTPLSLPRSFNLVNLFTRPIRTCSKLANVSSVLQLSGIR